MRDEQVSMANMLMTPMPGEYSHGTVSTSRRVFTDPIQIATNSSRHLCAQHHNRVRDCNAIWNNVPHVMLNPPARRVLRALSRTWPLHSRAVQWTTIQWIARLQQRFKARRWVDWWSSRAERSTRSQSSARVLQLSTKLIVILPNNRSWWLHALLLDLRLLVSCVDIRLCTSTSYSPSFQLNELRWACYHHWATLQRAKKTSWVRSERWSNKWKCWRRCTRNRELISCWDWQKQL